MRLRFQSNQVNCFHARPRFKISLVETVSGMGNLQTTCSFVCLPCRCLAQWVIPPTAGFMPSQPFPVFSFLGFPSGSSLPAHLSLCHPDAAVVTGNKSTSGDLWRHRVHIGGLWEFQPLRSRRLFEEEASEGEEEKHRRCEW